MAYDNLMTTGSLTETASFTGAAVFDTANGVAAASPINPLTGPGTPPGQGVLSVVCTAMSGTTPTFLPYVRSSNDSINWNVLAYPEDLPNSLAISTPLELFIPVRTKDRYFDISGTIAGTNPVITFFARFGPSMP